VVRETPAASPGSLLRDPIFFSWVQRDLNLLTTSIAPRGETASTTKTPEKFRVENSQAIDSSAGVAFDNSQLANAPQSFVADAAEEKPEQRQTKEAPKCAPVLNNIAPGAPTAVAPKSNDRASAVSPSRQGRKTRQIRKRKKTKLRRDSRTERNHADVNAGFTPTFFAYTVERKDRTIYYSALLNGDAENWFGQVIPSSPRSQTLTTPNPDVSASGLARLEVALQGVTLVNHDVTVSLNGATLGAVLPSPPQSGFFGQSHVVATFDVPASLLNNGSNTLTFTPRTCTPACPDTTIVDYARLTYPHQFRPDSGKLSFNLRGTQSVNIDGFATPSVRVIDYTDPLNVILSRPESGPSASGYSITVPESESRSKAQRMLYAIPVGQFEQPAALSLNQASSLNLNSNSADFLIVANKTFVSSMAPLVSKRQTEGMTPAVVDIEDVYDEFGYGLHGPQALKEFLQHAATSWTIKPRYIIFAGDASLDPRDYSNLGNFDFVPTKLVDATYNETASDDWLADFDNDGIADIPVGRLPLRNLSDANLVISKIVNFTPVTPEAALLIADDPGTPAVWDFETSSDDVQALLPPSVTVQRVNVRTEPSPSQATADIINGFTQGRSVVNYSGHGNVDVWSGAGIFTSANATALTNTKLSFVIVMDCLNGYYHDPMLLSLAEAFLKSNGGAVATFASSGLTTTYGQRQMELELYRQLYGAQSIPLGDAIRTAKAASTDIDVRTTWIFFGDPSIKIR
jgi:hypothetical protein